MPKEIPLPGVGKKGITIAGRHVSNDALLMTAGGLIAAIVLYRIGKPSTGVDPNSLNDQYLGSQQQQPASVEGTTTPTGAITGMGSPGPADPPAASVGSSAPSAQSVMTGTGGAATRPPILGSPAPGPSGGPSGISQMWTAARSLAAPIGPSQQSVRALAATGAGQSEAVQIAKAQQYNPPSGISQMWAAARALATPRPSPVTPAWTQYRRPPVTVGVAAPQSLNLGAGAQTVKPASARRY